MTSNKKSKKNKIPRSVIYDENYEESAFLHLLSKVQFAYTPECETKLLPDKYFNQRLPNCKQIFSFCVDHIFLFSLFYNN